MYSDLLAPPTTTPHRRRRAWWAWFGCVLLLTTVAVVWLERPPRPGDVQHLPWPVVGAAGLVVDGSRIEGPGHNRQVPIASVAKVMTAYVVLRDHPLTADEPGPTITVSAAEAAAYRGQLAKGESLVRVRAGETLNERQAPEAPPPPGRRDAHRTAAPRIPAPAVSRQRGVDPRPLGQGRSGVVRRCHERHGPP